MSDSVREPDTAGTEDTTAVEATAPAAPERVGSAGPDRPAVGWTEIGITLGGYLVLSVVGGIGLYVAGVPFDNPYSFPLMALNAVAIVLAIGVALAVRIRRPSAVGIRSTTWRWILVAIGAGLLLRVLAFGVILGYQALTGDTSNPQQGLVDSAAGSLGQLVLVLIGGALLAPLTEELALRGVLYGGLRRYGVPIALIVSSLAFGALHGWNVVLPVAILLGVANALMYERSRSIWPPVVCHVVFNASAFLLVAAVT